MHETASGERLHLTGVTLWTDFELYGTQTESMTIAEQRLEDLSRDQDRPGLPIAGSSSMDTVRLHRTSVTFLQEELSCPFDGPTVVITHHAPSPHSVPPPLRKHPLSLRLRPRCDERCLPATLVDSWPHARFLRLSLRSQPNCLQSKRLFSLSAELDA